MSINDTFIQRDVTFDVSLFSGGFTEDHPCVLSFWRVVDEFTDTQKRQLLKFVTSCSRPPLLGFKVGSCRFNFQPYCYFYFSVENIPADIRV